MSRKKEDRRQKAQVMDLAAAAHGPLTKYSAVWFECLKMKPKRDAPSSLAIKTLIFCTLVHIFSFEAKSI